MRHWYCREVATALAFDVQLQPAIQEVLGFENSGQEFEDFAAAVGNSTRGKGRGRGLVSLLSILGVYANAEKVLLTHAPSRKRAQSGDVLAAVKAKEAAAAAARAAQAVPPRVAVDLPSQ